MDSLKSELIEIGLLMGLNHPTTVSLSQRLDKLILEFQKYSFSWGSVRKMRIYND
ncbi:aspartyl-phosphate phosphatase Spo0E family protein [Metabacillus herbersteinensis]|uniref:Aspartyl-phosphate phosphatase Spo0E family protein n=1 Tax=Metabacillus herbersteinensis TaxID=283816 RepID=A0ABV6GIF5_9BACI